MKKYIVSIVILLIGLTVFAQLPKDIEQMTKEDVMTLSYDQLLELPFEDLLKLADIVGVSLDELYEMLLNKDVVSASKKVESSFEAPLSTSVISYDELKASGARSVEEALRLVPGLIVREKTNGNFDVHIRGNDNLPANHMSIYSENSLSLIMIDNRPVYNYVNGGTFWETLPIGLEDIERVEVVRGPSSALYGPNAVSGVVNIITKKPETERLTVNMDAQGGSQSTMITSIGIGKKIDDNLSLRVTGNFESMDRNQDLLYVYKLQDYVDRETFSSARYPAPDDAYYLFDPYDNVYDMYPDPRLARTSYGVNGYLFYDTEEDVSTVLRFGMQESEILSTTVGDNPTSYAGRESNTYYYDIDVRMKNLHIQSNQLWGVQDVVKQDTGFKVDLQTFNTNIEYDINIKGLNIRPGFYIQQAVYNDLNYLRDAGQGFLQGEKSIRSLAGSLRLDYTLLESLRLIAAGRLEKYQTNEDLYLSYQFIGSYNFNNIHNIRFVASRANRGPFLVDTYAAYSWHRDLRPNPKYIKFNGTENQNLCTMDMFELGYRVKPAKNIQADFEIFYTHTRDFGALYPDSADLNFVGGVAQPWVQMTFSNIDLESNQKGVSAAVSWVAKKNLVVKVFGTIQQTKVKNAITVTQDGTVSDMLSAAFFNFQNDPTVTHSTFFNPNKEDGTNEATPSYYGGLVVNYTPIDKLNINVNSYLYGAQRLSNKYGDYEIESKMILNAKVGYEFISGLSFYANIKNIAGEKVEFGYMDGIGPLYLLGLTYNLN